MGTGVISAQQLRMARAGLGWTLVDLAQKAEVNANTISRYEAGRDILASKLRRIEAALREAGIDFSDTPGSVTVVAPKPAH
jgi:transcriptional regulator with XRE-family HTH domain